MNIRILLHFIIICIILCGCKSSQKISKTIEYTSKELQIDDVFLQGCTQKELGNNNQAIEIFNEVIKSNPNYSTAYYQLADLLFQNKDIDKAIEYSKTAIAINPSNIWFHLQLAQIYINIAKYKEAAESYIDIIRLEPDVLEYYQELASIYQKANDINNMLKTLDDIERKWGISDEVSLFKLSIYNQLKQYDKAQQQINKLQKAFPNEVKYIAILAEIYMSKKEYEKALENYKKIEKINPNDPFINVSLANYYLIQKNEQLTFEYLNKAFANPDLEYNTKIQLLFSVYGKSVDENIEDFKKFFELLKTISNLYPEEKGIWELLSTGYLKVSDFENARKSIKKAIELGSSSYELYQNLLFAESTLNSSEELIEDCRKTIELFPEQPLPYLFLGVNLIMKEEYEEAKTTLETGLKLTLGKSTLLEDFFSNLAEVYEKLKDTINSDKYFDKTLEINPENYMVLNNYAYYLSLREVNLDKAEQMSKKVAEKHPNNITYIDTYAWVLYKMGKYSQAQKAMESILSQEKEWSSIIHEHYSSILMKINQQEKAKEHDKKAQTKKNEEK